MFVFLKDDVNCAAKLEMLDTNVNVHEVPSMFKHLLPENPRGKLDVLNSKCFQNKNKRYIEMDIRVDLNPNSKQSFEMLRNLPSFIPVSYKADWSFILRGDSEAEVPEKLLLGFYSVTTK